MFPLVNCIAPPGRYPFFLLGIDDAEMNPHPNSFSVDEFTAATKSLLQIWISTNPALISQLFIDDIF